MPFRFATHARARIQSDSGLVEFVTLLLVHVRDTKAKFPVLTQQDGQESTRVPFVEYPFRLNKCRVVLAYEATLKELLALFGWKSVARGEGMWSVHNITRAVALLKAYKNHPFALPEHLHAKLKALIIDVNRS